jgi:hypothetical protein
VPSREIELRCKTKARVDWQGSPQSCQIAFDSGSTARKTHQKIGSSINRLLHGGNGMLAKRQF